MFQNAFRDPKLSDKPAARRRTTAPVRGGAALPDKPWVCFSLLHHQKAGGRTLDLACIGDAYAEMWSAT